MKKVLTTCPYCGVGCSFYLQVDDNGKAVAVEASTEHPISSNQLCVKGWNAFQFINHPDRLQKPLIKRGGKFTEATWDEALELIASRLSAIKEQHGSNALMFCASAKATNEENYLMMKLARAVFNTNNVDHCARLCHASTVAGLAETFGSGAMTNSIDCTNEADCIFVIGSNTTEQHPLIGARIIKAVKNGAKLIVADARKIRLARLADLHLTLKSGTDVLFVNALMHVIIKDGLENRDFIKNRTENYEELKKVVAAYSPEKVASLCNIPADLIVRAAHLYAQAKNAMIFYAMGITQHTCGVDNVRSLANLAMLTGQVGRRATGINPLRGQNNVQGACDMGALPNVYSGYQKVTDEAVRQKFSDAWQVKDLPSSIGYTVTQAMNFAGKAVKAFYIMGENPVLSDPDQTHVKHALQKLDFLVVQDIFFTETCEYADVILPAVSFAEKDGTFTSTERRVQRIRQAVSPVFTAKPDWLIFTLLAKKLGYAGMQYNSSAEIMDEIAKLTPIYGGIDYKRIDQVGLQWPCLDKNHAGTKVLHVDKFTRGLGKFVPADYHPPMEEPDAEYPFILSTGRCYFQYHTGTMTRRTRLLEREERFPYVEINEEDAKRYGIRDRDFIYVATRRGEVKVMARIANISVGTIFMPFHYKEAPANLLTINALDEVAKIPEYKVCAAKLRIEK